MESVVRLHPFGHWYVAMGLLLGGGKLTGSSYSGNYIFVVITITHGDDDLFGIEIEFVFRYTRYLS